MSREPFERSVEILKLSLELRLEPGSSQFTYRSAGHHA